MTACAALYTQRANIIYMRIVASLRLHLAVPDSATMRPGTALRGSREEVCVECTPITKRDRDGYQYYSYISGILVTCLHGKPRRFPDSWYRLAANPNHSHSIKGDNLPLRVLTLQQLNETRHKLTAALVRQALLNNAQDRILHV